jgi:hypothetical protein
MEMCLNYFKQKHKCCVLGQRRQPNRELLEDLNPSTFNLLPLTSYTHLLPPPLNSLNDCYAVIAPRLNDVRSLHSINIATLEGPLLKVVQFSLALNVCHC